MVLLSVEVLKPVLYMGMTRCWQVTRVFDLRLQRSGAPSRNSVQHSRLAHDQRGEHLDSISHVWYQHPAKSSNAESAVLVLTWGGAVVLCQVYDSSIPQYYFLSLSLISRITRLGPGISYKSSLFSGLHVDATVGKMHSPVLLTAV